MAEKKKNQKLVIQQFPESNASPLKKFLTFLAVLFALVLMAFIVVTPLDLKSQTLLGVAGIALFIFLNRFKGRTVSLILIFISIIVSSRYMHWRLTATLGGDWSLLTIMGPLLLLAEIYTYVVLILGYVQQAWPLERKPAPLPDDIRHWPAVDVFIPTYNESLKVVRATVLAAKNMDWPEDKLKIYILDDGRRGEFRSFAAAAGVGYIVRPDNKHAKAGNINHALRKVRGEYVAIFDCDHIPTRSFLQMTMGWFFQDKKMALVQAPHHFYSPDPFERNLEHFKSVPNEGELFYGLIQKGNDLFNAVFFCGSCAVLRRAALDEVGGIAVETVTEDAHTALKMHRRGWRTAYIDIPQASGLATESLAAHIGQRIRWARGMVQIFRIDNPFFGRGLTIWQRLCYANAMLHFLFAVPRIIFLLAPLSFLLFGAHIFNATPLMVLAYALPHLIHATLTNARNQGKFRHALWAEIYEAVLSFYILIPTTLALINPKIGTFNVTDKGVNVEGEYFDRRIATPFIILLLLNLFGAGIGIYNITLGHEQLDAYAINVFWALYNSTVLGAAIAVAWEKRQIREANRVDVTLDAMLRLENGRTIACKTENCGMGGVLLKNVPENDLAVKDPLTISLMVENQELPLAARVLHKDGSNLRLGFEKLTLEEESWLVAGLFSRVDAWSDWHDYHNRDSIPKTAFVIFSHAARGIFKTLWKGFLPRPKTQEAAR